MKPYKTVDEQIAILQAAALCGIPEGRARYLTGAL